MGGRSLVPLFVAFTLVVAATPVDAVGRSPAFCLDFRMIAGDVSPDGMSARHKVGPDAVPCHAAARLAFVGAVAAAGSDGLLVLELPSSFVMIRNTSPLVPDASDAPDVPTTGDVPRAPRADASASPHEVADAGTGPVLLEVAYAVEWGTTCDDVRGDVAVHLNGDAQRVTLSPADFARLCERARGGDAAFATAEDVLATLGATAWDVLTALQAQTPHGGVLHGVVTAIDPLLPALEPAAATPHAPAAEPVTVASPAAANVTCLAAAPPAPEERRVNGSLDAEKAGDGATDAGTGHDGETPVASTCAGAAARAEPATALTVLVDDPPEDAAVEPVVPPPVPFESTRDAAPAAIAPPGPDAMPPVRPLAPEGAPSVLDPAPAPGPGLETASTPTRLAAPSGLAHGVATVAAALGVASAVLALSFLALYHRIAHARALEHTARRALYDACAASNGGATVRKLAEATGLNRKTAEYHLVYLARLGLLREDAPRDAIRTFAVPGTPRRPCAGDVASRIVAFVGEHPGASTREIAEALGVTRKRVERRVKDLVVAERAETRVVGGTRLVDLPARRDAPPRHVAEGSGSVAVE